MLPTNFVLDIAHQNFHMLGSRQGFAFPFSMDQGKFNAKLVSDGSHTCNNDHQHINTREQGKRRSNYEC